MARDRYLKLLVFLLVIKAAVLFFLVQTNQIGLSPDEAQYFTWSQALDVGYYSKPPGIAWEIFLGTHLFGNTEWGVRFFSAVIGFLLPVVVYFLGIKCKLSKEACLFAALMMAFSPVGFAASFFATTDGSMVLFFALATLIMVSNLDEPNYLLLGMTIAFGALFKWPIYLFWIYPLFFGRFNKKLFIGILISLIGLLPSLMWNMKHDFATFKHVFATVHVPQEAGLKSGNFFEFLGAQAGLFSPILFFLFIYALIFCTKNWHTLERQIKFCFWQTLSILVPFLILSFFKKMQGNWAVFAYPSAFILIAFAFVDRLYNKKLVQAGIALSLLLLAIVISVPFLEKRGMAVPYRLNAFRHQVGWDALGSALNEVGYDPSKDFLFADKYQMSSILSFYGEGQKRAYFLNLQGIRKNQFSYWPGMQEQELGKTGYFVAVENAPHLEKKLNELTVKFKNELTPFCESVQFVGIKPLFLVAGEPVKAAVIFKCTGYNGSKPSESDLY